MKYHFIPIRVAIIKKFFLNTEITNVGKAVNHLEPSTWLVGM